MTRDTLELLDELLKRCTLDVGHPTFEETAARMITARRELAAALETAKDTE